MCQVLLLMGLTYVVFELVLGSVFGECWQELFLMSSGGTNKCVSCFKTVLRLVIFSFCLLGHLTNFTCLINSSYFLSLISLAHFFSAFQKFLK